MNCPTPQPGSYLRLSYGAVTKIGSGQATRPESAADVRSQRDLYLLHLQGLNVFVQIGDTLLFHRRTATAHVIEDRSPHRHILVAMRGQFGGASKGAAYLHGWVFPA